MKKKIIISIVIIAMIIGLVLNIFTPRSYSKTTTDTITRLYGGQNDEITLTDNAIVFIAEGDKSDYTNPNVFNGMGHYILEQDAVFCADKGTSLVAGEFNVSSVQGPINDNTLGYILSQNKEKYNSGKNKYHREERVQIALWEYLEGNVTSDLYQEALAYTSNVKSWNPSMKVSLAEVNGVEKIKVELKDAGSVTFKVKIDNVEVATNCTSSPQYINIPGSASGKVDVKVEVTSTKYSDKAVYYRKLQRSENQEVWVITDITDTYKTKDLTAEIEVSKDVSMQKYITKVVDDQGTVTYNNTNTRKNMYSSSGEDNANAKKVTSASESSNMKSTYKRSNVVQIDKKDSVTYRIYVYNNENRAVSGITLADRLPHYTDSDGNKQLAASVVSITKGSSNTDIKDQWTSYTKVEDGKTYNWIKKDDISLTANGSTYFDVTLKFNRQIDGVLTNSATISASNNKTTYRTVDRDYVKMKTYSVSLEKFITQVTDKNGENAVTYNNRDGLRYNSDELSSDKIKTTGNVDEITRSPEKENNIVSVEAGDIVTYTIRLKNTHNNTSVKVTQIYDVFTKKNSGVKLTHVGAIEGNGGGSMRSEPYAGPKGTWNFNEVDRYIIDFANPVTIEPGNYVDVTIKFQVEIPDDSTGVENILANRAKIVQIKNTNGLVVSDSDGTANNADMDWVKTKVYKVALEKFVSKVEDSQGNIIKDLGTAREGKRYNEESTSGNKDTYKLNNKVDVEVGDLVTYTIKLENTSKDKDKDTPVKIKQFYDIFYKADGVELEYVGEDTITGDKGSVYTKSATDEANKYLFTSSNAYLLQPGESEYLNLVFKVKVDQSFTIQSQELRNKAGIIINSLENRNDVGVIDNDGENNNHDEDWIKTKTYAVSLEKYVSKVVAAESDGKITYYAREGKAEYLTYENGKYIDETDSDSEWTQHNWHKYNNIVKVNKGNNVTYTIKVNNDNQDTDVKNVIVKDVLPNGVDLVRIEGEGVTLLEDAKGAKQIQISSIAANSTVTFNIVVNVKEHNISNTILKNTAKIDSMQNRNGIGVEDTTGNNNEDSDYIELDFETTNETVEYTVEKVWVGKEENLDKNVTIELYTVKDGSETLIEGKAVTLDGKIDENEKQPWKYTWTDLPKYVDESKTQTINYIARELTENGNNAVKGDTKYNKDTTTQYIENGNIMIITNIIKDTPQLPDDSTTKYTVIKEWLGEKKEAVTVGLYKVENNSEVFVEDSKQELSNDNDWTHTWEGLEEGNYIAREFTKDGNSIVIGDVIYDENVTTEYIENKQDKTTTIKNTYKEDSELEKITFTVEKVWDDQNNSANRPEEIEIRLYKVSEDGSETFVSDVTLDGEIDEHEKEPWTYTWENLEKGTYVAREYNYNKGKIENGEKYDENYSVHYLDKPEKTIITNKNDSEIEEENDDLAIAGIVWNDMALDKIASDYNGLKDAQEKVLAGIKVMLYREEAKEIVATTYTNADGEYSFTNESLSTNTKLGEHERCIKGPLVPNTNRWSGTYYSYRVIFEYDGMTYTNTKYTEFSSKASDLDSNAEEDSNKREEFNDDFSVIKSDGAYKENADGTISKTCKLEYSTINESGYIPQSIHKYDASMAMQSSTELIILSNSDVLENKLKHVNLGLRGKDIFDLELTSDVYSTKVTVNGVEGTYNYNGNKVTVRREDAGNYSYLEDTANRYSNRSTYEGEAYSQSIRHTDLNFEAEKDKRVINYEKTGLGIEVTYKITVQNTSRTAGTATKITNYYDDNYTFVKAYSESSDLSCSSGASGNSVEITTPGTKLEQAGKMEIYVVYTLNNAESILKNIDMLATFNMAEITEYKTFTTEYQNNTNNEATRGLIDKDSAPGSANSEDVRLDPNLIGDTSTVKYYFGGNDLSILKYEDDTYATPTLYFVKDSDQRTITGKVFEDKTGLYSNIKTGNGKLDENEVGVFGATVELIEKTSEGDKVRYSTTTNEEGYFDFKGFLPGNYIIKYWYGDTAETVLKNQYVDNEGNKYNINGKSYNGEDFQATNNIGTHGAFELNDTPNFWYVYNEEDGGISTAKDNLARRGTVSENLTSVPEGGAELDSRLKELERLMTLLNKARDGENVEVGDIDTVGSLIEQTYMYATTEPMLLTVEKTELVEVKNDNGDKEIKTQERTTFGPYEITNMNFGIAEVPVTKIDLQKHVSEFTIVDSTGENVIAGIKKGDNGWIVTGDVLETATYDVSIEDNKLQGAKLQVKYEITSNMEVELNYDNSVGVKATISELKDIINNNLSYNSELKIDTDKNNSYYWEVSTLSKSSISDIANYNTIVKATANALNDINNGNSLYIVLEKVLSSTDSTLEDIIQSTVDIYEYNNIVEITGLNYENVVPKDPGDDPERYPQKDRIRTSERYIIIPGVHSDSAISETITIHPPTGDNSIQTIYYVIAAIGLAVLAVGVFGIKKYVIKK